MLIGWWDSKDAIIYLLLKFSILFFSTMGYSLVIRFIYVHFISAPGPNLSENDNYLGETLEA